MKNPSKKILSLVLSIVILMSSVGFTTASAFDSDSFRIKSPFVISSVVSEDGGGHSFINIEPLKISLFAKRNTKSSAKKASGFFSIFEKLKLKKQTPAKKQVTTTKPTTVKATTTKSSSSNVRAQSLNYSSAFLNEAMNAINKARRAAGVGNLRIDSGLARAASVRAKELNTKFDHTRPNGGKFYTVFADCGITRPQAVAENISTAKRFDNATDIVNVWLSSSGHKANIVNGKYTRFGMAWYINGNGKEFAIILLGNG